MQRPQTCRKNIRNHMSCDHRLATIVYELEKLNILGFFLDLPISGAKINMKQCLSEKNKKQHFTKNNTLTHSQRPTLAVGSSGRLVKITTDLHPCCLGFCRAGRYPAPLWSSRQLQRGGAWGHMNHRGGLGGDCGLWKRKREKSEWAWA